MSIRTVIELEVMLDRIKRSMRTLASENGSSLPEIRTERTRRGRQR